jgi:nickel-dependent lactate racemase
MTALRYGTDSSVKLQFASGLPLETCGGSEQAPLGDPAAAVMAALAEPLEYPPLVKTTTPGDRVVIVLAPGLPQVAEVTAAVVDALLGSAVDADGITILRSDVDTGADDPLRLIPRAAATRIRILSHDPTNRRNLAYLAASEGGEPILLNRLLTDADVVLPVGCTQRERAAGYFGIHTVIYPEFSDLPTQARFRKHDRFIGNGHHRELQQEVNHVAWLLGVNFSLQVVPSGGDGILHVVAGQSDVVRRRCRELYRAAWSRTVAQRASLVVVALEGPRQQTWENLGSVIENATQLVEEGGAIAVCCDLAAAPGPALQRLVGAASREDAVRHIRRDNPRDALPALQLARTLQSKRIYLLSRLDAGLVEDLDMIPIAAADELARLVQRSKSCLVLANAVHAMVQVENE